jgi:hypothetical protein
MIGVIITIGSARTQEGSERFEEDFRDGILGHPPDKKLEPFFHAIHNLFYWRILQKTTPYFWFQKSIQKNPQNKKTQV